MRYTKVDFNERSKAELDTFFNQEECKEGIAKFGHIDLTDIKTLYTQEGPSCPMPLETIDGEDLLTEEQYYAALDKIECNFGFSGIAYGIETKSGTFIDMRDTPLPIDVETPYETLTQEEIENKEELFAKMDADMVSKSLTDLTTNELQQ